MFLFLKFRLKLFQLPTASPKGRVYLLGDHQFIFFRSALLLHHRSHLLPEKDQPQPDTRHYDVNPSQHLLGNNQLIVTRENLLHR
jgi:hypothetical protein